MEKIKTRSKQEDKFIEILENKRKTINIYFRRAEAAINHTSPLNTSIIISKIIFTILYAV